jgi:hypothetical protein
VTLNLFKFKIPQEDFSYLQGWGVKVSAAGVQAFLIPQPGIIYLIGALKPAPNVGAIGQATDYEIYFIFINGFDIKSWTVNK